MAGGVPLASAFVRVRPDVDRREFEKRGREAGQAAGEQFADGFYRDASGRLRAANGRFATDAEKAAHEGGTRSGKSFSKGFAKELKSGGDSILSRVAAISASRFALIGAAAVAATPGVLHLTAALLPAVGAVTALPAAFAAVKLASATVKVAVAGVGDAIEKGLTGTAKQAEKALEGLPPAARSFARSIVALKPQIEGLRSVVSERFFRPFADDIRPLAERLFPLLNKEMSNLAGPLGGIAEQFAETGRKAVVLGGLRQLFQSTRLSVINLRGSLDPLITALAVLIKGTVPQLPRLASGLTRAAQQLSTFIVNATRSGAVNRAFAAGVATLKDLGGILVNVGSILKTVLSVAGQGSETLLSNLRALTGQAAQFLKSTQGLAALGSVFTVFDQLGGALQTSLAAVLPAIADSLTVLGPAIAELAGPVAQLVVAAAPLLPIFAGVAATLITRLTPAISALAGFLSQHATVVKAAAAAVAAFLIVQKAANLALGIQAAGGLLAYAKTIRVVTVLTKVWTGVQAAFNLVMDANPIALVILAIAALVAGLIYAFKHSERFRTIVLAVWGAIKVAIKATVDWIVNVAWPALKKAWDAIAAAAVWLWHHVIEPVWNGIKAVISVVVGAVKFYIKALVLEFKIIAAAATWLWRNIFAPVFGAIRKIIEVWWLAVQIVFKALANIITFVVVRAVNVLKTVFKAVFNFVLDTVVKPWWQATKLIFNAFRTYVLGPVVAAMNALRALFVKIFNAVATTVRAWWTAHVSPIFAAVRAGFNAVAVAFYTIWNTKIKPFFNTFVGFFRKTVVDGFKSGVSAITSAWDKVREAARKPVAFVVNKVINPFINGLNAAAKIVGVKDRVSPIKGFAVGGEVPGYATGGKITGAPSATDNRLAPARIPGVGAVKLAGGEFVVNAADTRKALPLLKWINAGMKGGARLVDRMLGKPLAAQPGDGSEGWAFADGGLVGWAKDVWGALSDPVGTIKKPFEAMFKQIPGAGMIKDFLIGSAKRLLNGAVGWLTGSGGPITGSAVSTARAYQARAFVQSQAGKPYVWASAGPGGYDCSGIVSAAYNILKGDNPYSHTFSTGSLPGPWFDTGRRIGALVAGWSHPGQSPASSSVGHMAGQIAGLPFESSGSRGVRVGANARRITEFANIGAARAMGGLIGNKIQLFDNGGFWPSGTLGANLSGRTEYVQPAGADAAVPLVINFHERAFAGAIVSDSKAAEDMVVKAVKSAKRGRRL